jgi:hypothetical protein
MVPRFLPSAARVIEARAKLSAGHYGDLDQTMGTTSLPRPGTRDLCELITEFDELVGELGLRDTQASGFVVLLPVVVNGVSLTTPVLVDVERCELAFTSHPQLGASSIGSEVLSENPDIANSVREQLLGVLATWHNFGAADEV